MTKNYKCAKPLSENKFSTLAYEWLHLPKNKGDAELDRMSDKEKAKYIDRPLRQLQKIFDSITSYCNARRLQFYTNPDNLDRAVHQWILDMKALVKKKFDNEIEVRKAMFELKNQYSVDLYEDDEDEDCLKLFTRLWCQNRKIPYLDDNVLHLLAMVTYKNDEEVFEQLTTEVKERLTEMIKEKAKSFQLLKATYDDLEQLFLRYGGVVQFEAEFNTQEGKEMVQKVKAEIEKDVAKRAEELARAKQDEEEKQQKADAAAAGQSLNKALSYRRPRHRFRGY